MSRIILSRGRSLLKTGTRTLQSFLVPSLTTRIQECSGEEKHPGSPSVLLSVFCCQQESCSGGGADQHPGQVPGPAGLSQQTPGGGGGYQGSSTETGICCTEGEYSSSE